MSSRPLFVRAMGVVVAVLPPDEERRARWEWQWSRAVVSAEEDPGPGEPDRAEVDLRDAHEEEGDTLDYAVTTRVTMAALEKTSQHRLNLHAAALADDQGRVLGLVARSGTGKTTAASVLGKRLGYVSDETLSIGDDLRVAPHPKPLSVVLDPTAGKVLGKAQPSPDEAGLGPTPADPVLARLVLLNRDPDLEPGLRPLELVEAMARIVPESSGLGTRPDSMATLARVVSLTDPHELVYAEITDHVEELLALLAAPPDAPPAYTHFPGRTERLECAAGEFVRAPWHDAVATDDDLIVMVEGTAYHLPGLAVSVWLAAERPVTLAELVAHAEAEHGPNPQATEFVGAAVDVLLKDRLLVSGTPASTASPTLAE